MSAFAAPTIGQPTWGPTLNTALSDLDTRLGRVVLDVKEVGGAAGDGVTDDTTAITTTLAAAGAGSVVYLPPGAYLISGGLTVPPGVTLAGTAGVRTELGSASLAAAPTRLVLKSTFSGTAAVNVLDKEVGGYSGDNASVQIRDLNIDCSAKTSGTVDGIQVNGRCNGLLIENVSIYKPPNCGLRMLQYTRADTSVVKTINAVLRNVVVHATGSVGFSLNGNTDCHISNCYSLGAGDDGWLFSTSCANTIVANCRAEWSTNQGFHLTGAWNTGTGSGGILLTGCSTDRNGKNGFLVDSTGTSPISITAPMCRRDGRNGGTGGGSFAGIAASAATTPVLVTNPTVYPGVDDDGTATNSPQYGINASGCTYVAVVGGYVHAASTPVQDSGTNTTFHVTSVAGATGSTASPTRVPPSVSTAVSALGVPTPRNSGIAAWSFDPCLVGGGLLVTNGTIYLVGLYIPQVTLVSNLLWSITTAGVTATAGQNEVGLYDSTGARLAHVNVDANVTSAGAFTTAIGSTLTLQPAMYYLAMVFQAGTAPTIGRAGANTNTGINNFGNGTATARFASNLTLVTTGLPSSLSFGSNVKLGSALFAGVN